MSGLPERMIEYSKLASEKLGEFLPKSDALNKRVVDAMNYSLLAGGKRFRPYLLLRACEICGGNREDAFHAACAIECIHTYSLIHDDLPCMDDDDLRRGKPTCHVQFDEPTALLAGDSLLTYAFQLISEAPLHGDKITKLVQVLSSRAGFSGMVGGQMADLLCEEMQPDEKIMYYIHEHKTADLIVAAVLMGAICAGADSEELSRWEKFGYNCGIAFQISDDVCDCISTSEEMGKEVGKDADAGKQNAVRIFGL